MSLTPGLQVLKKKRVLVEFWASFLTLSINQYQLQATGLDSKHYDKYYYKHSCHSEEEVIFGLILVFTKVVL